MNEPRILTIGHSNHPIERFLALVQGAGVRALADVRSFPSSRYAPQFNKEALAKSLEEKAIAYLYLGKELGGRTHERPSTPESFRAGLDRVVAESARHRIALMCAERDPLDCHRLMLAREGLAGDDLFSREARLRDAYRARRGHRPHRTDLGFTRDRHETDTSRKHPTCEAE
jgi:uncharacterized protein (DUF488 family)